MPLTSLLQSLEEGENTNALARVKTTSTMASSTTTTMMASTLGRVVGQRAVLGDRGNFRAPSGAQTLRSAKADAFDAGEFRKPALAPVSRTAPHKKAAAPPPPPPAEDLASQLKSTVRLSEAAPRAEVSVTPLAYSSARVNDVQDIDTETDNPQLVACYVKDIYKYLLHMEAKTPIRMAYMDGYKIKPTMRTILIDWLIEVHGRFKLLQETLFLTVAVMDRFLQADSTVIRHELQLVGLTSMFVAAKFEEMYAPEIDDFVYMADKAYTKKAILRMEYRILQALDFGLGRPIPLHFLRRYTKAASHACDDVDVLHHTLAKYLMELTLPEYDFCHHPPSLLAAAALCLSLMVLDENQKPVEQLWNDTLVYYSGYASHQLVDVVAQLCGLIIKSETSKFQAVRKKYTASKFYNISTIHHLKSPLVHVYANKTLKDH